MKPIDVSSSVLTALMDAGREYILHSQMRSIGGNDYIDYVKQILSPVPPTDRRDFALYTAEIVDDPRELVRIIREKDAEHGLSRIIAGYGWNWASRKNKDAFDIQLANGVELR